jgi:phosphomannomutase
LFFEIKPKVMNTMHLQKTVGAGNGSGGGFLVWDVLDKLGADTVGSLHLNPDGIFPNHIPIPEDNTAMVLTRANRLQK